MKKILIWTGLFSVLGLAVYWSFNKSNSSTASTEPSFEYQTAEQFPKNMAGAAYFSAFHHAIRTRAGDSGPRYELNYQHKAFKKALSRRKNNTDFNESLPWIERGPANVGGRTRALLVDPEDSTHQTWYLGSASGGIWKTEDAGQTWANLTKDIPNLATSTLAMSAANPDIIYAGTGEGFNTLGVVGNGIWKSTDKGQTWNLLESTANDDRRFGYIMRMAVNPADPDEIVVATRTSARVDFDEEIPLAHIMRSVDGGNSWTTTYTSNSTIHQVYATPSKYSTMYAAVNSREVIRSYDAGRTWERVFNAEGLGLGRMELAISPTDTNFVYISAQSSQNDFELYRSSDAGEHFYNVRRPGSRSPFGPIFNGQGWWDNTIAVHPYDPTTVFVGGAGPIVSINTAAGFSEEIKLGRIDNTTDFLTLTNADGLGDGVEITQELADFANRNTRLVVENYRNVEIRFGPEKSQMAHRFFFDAFTLEAAYQDYVEVPFEVWDTENDVQLAVAFVDSNEDGEWDLNIDTAKGQEVEFLSLYGFNYSAVRSNLGITSDFYNRSMYLVFAASAVQDTIDFTQVTPGELSIQKNIIRNASGVLTAVTDGYNQFDPSVNSKGVHVDHHNLILIPLNNAQQDFIIVNANDGGVAFSTDSGERFIQTGDLFGAEALATLDGFNTSQFYGVDKKNGEDRYIGGTQDNGSWYSSINPNAGSPWNYAPSGDGFEAVWHYEDGNKILQSSQFNIVYRSLNGGATWDRLSLPGRGPFITRLASPKQDPDLVFAVNDQGVLRSTNFGDSWKAASMPEEWRFSNLGPALEVSLASPLVVWSGSSMIENNRIAVSRDGGNSFQATNLYENATMGRVTNIVSHPLSPNIAYALFSPADGPKILKTSDYGQRWEDISGFVTNREESTTGFPDVATYSLVVMPFDTNIIWAGTEIGLFQTLDGGESWSYADNGLPPVAIFEMKIVNDEVVLATHGRGIWSVELSELEGYEPLEPEVLLPEIAVNGKGFGRTINGSFSLRSAYDSSFVEVSIPFGRDTFNFRSDRITANPEPIRQNFDFTINNIPDDTLLIADVTVLSYSNGIELVASAEAFVFQIDEDVQTEYVTDFDDGKRDFARLGFNITSPQGFSDNALHSPHPYPDESEFISILQKPILITESSSVLRYDEIALIELGRCSTFGCPEFWDFVAVEATRDAGKNWIVMDGYDARREAEWEEAYLQNRSGNQDLFLPNEINLAEFFENGDTVFIRFRLKSDPAATGWGWAIDNINVSNTVNSREEILENKLELTLYPNPATNILNMNLALLKPGSIEIAIYDTSGKAVIQNNAERRAASRYTEQLDISSLSNGMYIFRLRIDNELISKTFMVND